MLLGGVTATLERKQALAVPDGSMFERGDLTDLGAVTGAAVVTYVLSTSLGLGPVVASALVGLAAGVVLPAVAPGGETLAAAFCASFAGMSADERLRSLWKFGLVGVFCGAVFVAVSGAFVGAGGKLGTIAFISCVAVSGGGELLGHRRLRRLPSRR